MTDVRVAGFTGTSHGMTHNQRVALRATLLELRPRLFVHGGCIEADDTADAIADKLGINRRVLPQSKNPDKAVDVNVFLGRDGSGCTVDDADPDPLRRNEAIVRLSDVLIACPMTVKEINRSGTWATVRRARKAGIPVIILEP